jgi:hypothetical protein
MPDGAVEREHAERRLRPSIRTAMGVASTVAGALLTLLTIVLSVSNVVNTKQAIALALPATLATLGGWISMTVPDAWIAWRRGFEQGCKVAMSCQTTPGPARPAVKAKKQGPAEQTVVDLVARYGSRAGSRTQRGDGV